MCFYTYSMKHFVKNKNLSKAFERRTGTLWGVDIALVLFSKCRLTGGFWGIVGIGVCFFLYIYYI